MAWTDSIGKAWDTFEKWDDENVPNPFSAIGGAYTAAADSAFGDAVGVVAKPVGNVLGAGLDVLGYPLDRVKRGLSTGAMLANREDGTSIRDADTWAAAWEASEDVSIGQAYATNVQDAFNFGQDFAQEADPYSPENRAKAKEFYTETWAGRLSSGAADVILDFTVDPLVFGGKAAKLGELARTTIKGADRAPALATSVGNSSITSTKSALKAGERLKNLYTKTDNMTAAEMAALPAFKSSGDAGAIAYFFEKANLDFAGDEVARHQYKADVFGAVLGDQASIDAIKSYGDEMAEQIKAAGSAPATMKALTNYTRDDFGANMIAVANIGDKDALAALKKERERDMLRLSRVVDTAGSTNKIGGTLLENIGLNATLDKIDQRGTSKLKEYTVPNGLFGKPVRYVIGQANQRVPGYVNIKDPTKGYSDLVNTLAQMKHTPAADRKLLADKFVRAATDDDRRLVVQEVEKRIFVDAASKMKPPISQQAAEKFMEESRGRRAAYQKGMADRLYSAADDDTIVQFIDPEDNVTHVFDRAFLTTHIEENHELTDPRVLDDILSKGTNARLLERWMGKGGKATKVSDVADASKESLDYWGTMITRAWKDAALMRLAYPARIQVDTQARTIVQLGLMQWLMTRKEVFGGQAKYLLENADGQKSLKNVFKEGDLDAVLSKQLLGGDKGKNYKGYDIAPAMDMEDVRRIRAGIESHGGAAADIGNDITSQDLRRFRGNGSWGKIKTGTPEWFENWKRAADQIRTSPTARKSLELQDLDQLKAWVISEPKAMAEWKNFEASSKDMDDWLARVLSHSNNYLPSPELKATISNPERARELFDLRSAEDRLVSVQPLKAVKTEKVQAVKDVRSELKAKKAEYAALPKRSKERRALNVEIKQLQQQRKTAQSERWQAKAEYGDAKNPPAPGMVNPVTGKIDPMDVHGENYSPIENTGIEVHWNKVRERWYKVAADAPETIMGRSPIYADTFQQYMRDAIDRLGTDGIDSVGFDNIRKQADRRARQEVGDVLFDATSTSNAAHAMRFLSPFFSAWEDTMRKWGKLFYDNPTVPLTASKLWESPANAGFVEDSEGNYKENGKYYNATGDEITEKEYATRGEYIVLPKIFGGKIDGNKNVGSSFKINRNALNVLFQGDPAWLPGMGPLVQIPTNEIVRRSFPAEANNPVLKYILPFGVTDDSIPYQVLPSWMKQVRDSMGNSKDFSQTYATLMSQEMIRYNMGERKSKPDIDEINRRTRNWYLLRAGLANASPISIQPTPKMQFYIDQAHQYRAKYGGEWQEKYYDKFPQFFEMSLSLSHNETGIQATEQAYNATQRYRKEIRENPELGWFFVGSDNVGAFDPNVNTWQRSTEAGQGKNFRNSKNPDAAIKDLQAQKGWLEYNKARTFVDLELGKRGLHNIQQKGAEDLQLAMNLYRDALAGDNSAWAEAYQQRDSSKVLSMVNAAQSAWKKDPKFAARSDQVALKGYLEARSQVRQLLALRKTKSIEHPDNKDILDAWSIYVKGLVDDNIGFQQMYNRTLEADDLSQELG